LAIKCKRAISVGRSSGSAVGEFPIPLPGERPPSPFFALFVCFAPFAIQIPAQ
jgi:hypothetical protein